MVGKRDYALLLFYFLTGAACRFSPIGPHLLTLSRAGAAEQGILGIKKVLRPKIWTNNLSMPR